MRKFITSPTSEHAKKIFDTYIKEGATQEINIERAKREQTWQAIEQNQLLHAFEHAHDHVMSMKNYLLLTKTGTLKLDTFARFKKTELWTKFCQENEEELKRELRKFRRRNIQSISTLSLQQAIGVIEKSPEKVQQDASNDVTSDSKQEAQQEMVTPAKQAAAVPAIVTPTQQQHGYEEYDDEEQDNDDDEFFAPLPSSRVVVAPAPEIVSIKPNASTIDVPPVVASIQTIVQEVHHHHHHEQNNDALLQQLDKQQQVLQNALEKISHLEQQVLNLQEQSATSIVKNATPILLAPQTNTLVLIIVMMATVMLGLLLGKISN